MGAGDVTKGSVDAALAHFAEYLADRRAGKIQR